jgi:hypothetical protein
MGFGGTISSILITIFQVSPEAFGAEGRRSRIDKILALLVGLGVSQAHEMESCCIRTSDRPYGVSAQPTRVTWD